MLRDEFMQEADHFDRPRRASCDVDGGDQHVSGESAVCVKERQNAVLTICLPKSVKHSGVRDLVLVDKFNTLQLLLLAPPAQGHANGCPRLYSGTRIRCTNSRI